MSSIPPHIRAQLRPLSLRTRNGSDRESVLFPTGARRLADPVIPTRVGRNSPELITPVIVRGRGEPDYARLDLPTIHTRKEIAAILKGLFTVAPELLTASRNRVLAELYWQLIPASWTKRYTLEGIYDFINLLPVGTAMSMMSILSNHDQEVKDNAPESWYAHFNLYPDVTDPVSVGEADATIAKIRYRRGLYNAVNGVAYANEQRAKMPRVDQAVRPIPELTAIPVKPTKATKKGPRRTWTRANQAPGSIPLVKRITLTTAHIKAAS